MGGVKGRSKFPAIALLFVAVIIFSAVFFAGYRKANADTGTNAAAVLADTGGNYIHIGDYFMGMPNYFEAQVITEGTSMDVSGVFIRRKTDQQLSADTIYWCSVNPIMEVDGSLIIVDEALENNPGVIQNFMHASYTPIKRVNNEWQEFANDPNGDFWLEVSDSKTAVIWYLRQTAPLGNYGVKFRDTKGTAIETDDAEYVYQVVHTGDWTFVSMDSRYGTKIIRNFVGGPWTPLRLYLSYNEGAMVTSKLTEIDLPNGATVGNVLPELIVNTEMWNLDMEDKNSMGKSTYRENNIDNIQVSVMNGDIYQNLYTMINGTERNAIDLIFNTPLENKVYIIKFGSALDSYIYGTLIIDNTGMSGVNLSTMWKFFVIFGAVLAVAVSVLYFIPVVIRHRNEIKVFRENERIQREKMGIRDATISGSGDGKKKKKGGLAQGLHDFKAKWKGTYNAEQEKKKAEEEKLKLEAGITDDEPRKRKDAGGHSRFTDTIREKRERRQIAQQQGLTEEDLKRMEDSVARLKKAKEDSFVHLRDETPIAKYKEKKTVNSADDISKNVMEHGGAVFTPIEGAGAEPNADGGTENPTAPAVPQMAEAEANKELVQQGGAVFVPLSEGVPVEYVPEEIPENAENPTAPAGK